MFKEIPIQNITSSFLFRMEIAIALTLSGHKKKSCQYFIKNSTDSEAPRSQLSKSGLKKCIAFVLFFFMIKFVQVGLKADSGT